MDPDAIGVDDRGAGTALDVPNRLAQGADGVEEVLPVAVEDREVQEAAEVVRCAGVRRLVALRNRDSVAVVLHGEDDGQLLPRRAVDGLVVIALGGRRLADGAENDVVAVMGLQGAREADGVERVVRDAGGDVLDSDLGLGEMVRHVAPPEATSVAFDMPFRRISSALIRRRGRWRGRDSRERASPVRGGR